MPIDIVVRPQATGATMAVRALDAANDVFDRCDGLLTHAVTLRAGPVHDDVLRSAHVLALGGLDTYMHQLIRTSIDGRRTIPRTFDRDPVVSPSFDDLAEVCRAAVAARRAGVNHRPTTRVRDIVYRQFLRKPLTTFDVIQKVIRFVGGPSSNWQLVWTKLGTKPDTARKRLDRINHRRNQTVHEGDHKRGVRPRTISYNSVRAGQVRKDVEWLRDLVNAIDAYLVP